jgi:hypothetical protein
MKIRVTLASGAVEEYPGDMHCRVLDSGALTISTVFRPPFPWSIRYDVVAVYAPGMWSSVKDVEE